MNKDIVKAKGKYLMFFNSGDYIISRDVLTTAFSLIQDKNADVFLEVSRSNRKMESGFQGNTIHQFRYHFGYMKQSITRLPLLKEIYLKSLDYMI